MNAITLTEGAPSIDIPRALVQFFLSVTPSGVDTALEAIGPDGTPLDGARWSYQAPRWVLDPRDLSDGTVRLRAYASEGTSYPAGSELRCTVVAGSRQYFASFEDMAGRTARDVLQLSSSGDALRLRRAPRARETEAAATTRRSATREVWVVVDGSASMRALAVRPEVEAALAAIRAVAGDGGKDEAVKLSWHVSRNGELRSLSDDDPVADLAAQPSSIGAALTDAHFTRPAHYIVVTDDTPDGLERWVVPSGSTVQVVVVGPASYIPDESQLRGIRLSVHAGLEDGTALIAQVAEGLGRNE